MKTPGWILLIAFCVGFVLTTFAILYGWYLLLLTIARLLALMLAIGGIWLFFRKLNE